MVEVLFTGKLCTINNRYNRNFSLTNEYRAFKTALSYTAKIAMTKQKQQIFAKNAELYCSIYFEYLREKDIDSIVKPVLDALQGIVFENDKSVKRLMIEKHKSKTNNESIFIHIDNY